MSKNTAGYFYEGRKIHRLFGLSSLALLGSTLWMIWQDHAREWKAYQQKARDMEISRLEREKEVRTKERDPAALAKAEQARADAEKALSASSDRLSEREHAAKAAQAAWYQADQTFRAAKAEVDAARYRFEEASQHHPDHAAAAEREYRDWQGRLEALRLDLENRLDGLEKARGDLAAVTADRDGAEKRLSGLNAQVTRLEKRLTLIAHNPANDLFRDQPGVDYMQPILRIKQSVPPDLRDDFNFVKVQKVDRCLTCHVNADRPGFEDQSEPFRSHPRLDLYLGGRSAHPVESFGCTVCHGGQGGSTDFLHAYHTPIDGAKAEEWQGKYGWLHFQEEHGPLWNFPMLPKGDVTASCRKCHTGRVEVDGADQFNRGKHVFETAGCWGCHKAAGFEPKPDPKEGRAPTAADAGRLDKVGPPLVHIGCKLSPDFVAKWLADPKGFRPHTRMPSFFGAAVSPDMTPDLERMEANQIRAITAYLFHASLSTQGPEHPPGDAAAGKRLVETVGCLACHTLGGKGPALAGREVDLKKRQADFDAFGPDLSSIGSKVNQGWLNEWLKDPKHYFPGGRMPDLRLTASEAADAAAYLMTLRDEAFERREPPQGDPAGMKRMLFDKLRAKETLAVVNYILEAGPKPAELMTLPSPPEPIPPGDVPVELGRVMIRQFGCNGCHVIGGFEDDKGIGAELTEIGSKDLAQVDFGFVPDFQASPDRGHFSENVLRSRHAWIRRKISDPRCFDIGRARAPLDRLVMPRFGFSEADAAALTTFLLSMGKERIPVHRQERLSEDQAALERGRRLIKDANCAACHRVGAQPKAIGIPASPEGREAWVQAHRKTWLSEPLLLNDKGAAERAASTEDAEDRRMPLLSGARGFLEDPPELSAEAARRLSARGVDPKGLGRLDLLGMLEASRRDEDLFKPPVPFRPRVAGIGEGLPGLAIADSTTETPKEQSGRDAPPFLLDLGARTQPDWLFRFLKDPDWDYSRRGGPIRPSVPLRMPTFGFTDAEAAALVRYFCLASEAAFPFGDTPPSGQLDEDRVAARYLTTEGDCRSCHVVDAAGDAKIGPDLDHVAGRLRRDWVRRYIQFPEQSQPFVKMPAHWRPKPDGSLTDEYPPEEIPPEDFPAALKPLAGDPKRQLEAILDYLLTPPSARGE